MKVSPGQPFYTHMSNFSSRKSPLLNLMIIAHTTTPPDVIHALNCKDPPIRTPELDSDLSNSRIYPPNASDKNREEVFTMHYKPLVRREAQLSRQTIVQNNDTKRLVQDWPQQNRDFRAVLCISR